MEIAAEFERFKFLLILKMFMKAGLVKSESLPEVGAWAGGIKDTYFNSGRPLVRYQFSLSSSYCHSCRWL